MGVTDDFLVPSGINETEQCDAEGQILYDNYLLPTGAILSTICYVYLLWMYFGLNSPVLKRHPTTLAIYRCLFEIIFVQQYLWIPFVGTSYFYRKYKHKGGDGETIYDCQASDAAAVLAFVTQFSLLASELCFLIISMDLRQAYTNPFSSYRENRYYFASIVLGLSLGSAVVLVLMGDKVYGLASEGSVWIQDRRADNSIPYPKFVLFYLEILFIFSYCIWANFRFYINNERGLGKTLNNRISIMQRAKKFTLGYIAMDVLTLLLEFFSFILYPNSSESKVRGLSSYFYSMRGVFAISIIFYSNWTEITWENMNPFRWTLPRSQKIVDNVAREGLQLQPHLNTALRAEILYFTTQGIMCAAREFKRHHESGADDDRMYSFDEGPEGSVVRMSMSSMHQAGLDSDGGGVFAGFLERKSSLLGGADNKNIIGERTTVNTPINRSMVSGGPVSSNSGAHTGSIISDMEAGQTGSRKFAAQEIERLKEQQSAAVSSLYDDAYKEELEQLGGSEKRASMKKRRSNPGPSKTGGGSSFDEHGSGVEDVAMVERKSFGGVTSASRKKGAEQTNPMYSRPSERFSERLTDVRFTSPGTSSLTNLSEGEVGGDGRDDLISAPPTRKSLQQLQEGLADRGQKNRNGKPQLSAVIERNSKDSADGSQSSGASTEKWRDTMDIEFAMLHNNGTLPTKMNNEWSNSDVPSWQRTERLSDNISRDHSESSTGTGDMLIRSIQKAMHDAKSLFNSEYRDFRFKDYCPKLFAKVREMSNIDAEDYARSFETTCKERFSEGRSGAFMFFSSDQRCIVKTLSAEEMGTLREVLPRYIEYLRKHPNSLLVRIIGAHCITMYGVRIYFVIMLNFFPVYPLSERYDLKGSWVNRHGFEGNRSTKSARMRRAAVASANASPLFQDNDLQHKISLEPEVAECLVEQIQLDSQFLREMGLMDYSLLIGVKRERFEIHSAPPPSGSNNPGDGADQDGEDNDLDSSLPEDASALARKSTHGTYSRESLAVSNLQNQRASQFNRGGALGHSMSAIDERGSIVSPVRDSSSFSRESVSGSSSRNSLIGGGGGGGLKSSIAPLTVDLKAERANKTGREWRIYSEDNYSALARDPDGGLRARFVEGPGTYYIGMIDILQEWNWKKRIERFFKTWVRLYDPDGISAVEPDFYQERFWQRCVLDTFDGISGYDDDDNGGVNTQSLSAMRFTEQLNRPSMMSAAAGSLGASSHATYGENEPPKIACASSSLKQK